MFASLIESIKGTRKLTLNHWRYKLLHWAFGINPATVDESSLPRFLYTHYCPLFHLTNIILLVSPVILVFSILSYLFKFVSVPLSYISEWSSYLMENYKVATKPQKSDKQKELEDIYGYINRRLNDWNYDFNIVTTGFINERYDYEYHSREEFLDVVTKYLEKVKARRAEKAAADKQRAAQMVFWINLSRTILKFVYACIALFGLYLVVFYIVPFIAWLIYCMFFVNWWYVLYVLGGAIISVGVAAIPVSIIVFCIMKLEEENSVVANAAGHFTKEVFGTIFSAFRECYDFIAVLYENNCPPVQIVSGSDEEALNELEE